MSNNNQILVSGAKNGMEQFKKEVASDLGLRNYDALDKGELTSRQNGYVGGNMTKKMVYFAEQQINQAGPGVVADAPTLELPERIRLQNQQASQSVSGYIPQTTHNEHKHQAH